MKKILYAITMMALVLACEANTSAENDKPLHNKPEEEVYYPKDENSLRLVSYNVGAFSKYMDNSTSMIASMMKEIKADVIVMNELDKNNDRHNVDQLDVFAKSMGWNSYYGMAMNYKNGEYGNGLASSKALTIVDKFVISIPKDSGQEDRSCVVVEFEDFVYAGTHLDVKSANDRLTGVRKITAELQKRYGDKSKPVFLAGDMNVLPEDEVITELKKNWQMLSTGEFTYPAPAPVKCIDYIFALHSTASSFKLAASGVCTKFSRGDAKTASDHLPVYADILFSK